jgi:hypothetical protein
MTTNTPLLKDIQTHWAKPWVDELVKKNIFSGFPDQTFRPDRSMTRAEFAASIQKAFSQPRRRNYTAFRDVPSNH